MYWFSVFIVAVFAIAAEFLFNKNWIKIAIIGAVSLLVTIAIVSIDYYSQVTDTEVWSGTVVDWKHEEEWDEWHPPVESCSTDSKGNRSCTTTPGYWEHHPAENHIKTSDNGWMSVKKSPDGEKKFNDSWPNDVGPLKEYWPEGTPSASTHKYINKVNASYSIYRHPDIDLDKYTNLPEYPVKVTNLINVDRIVGDVPNKEKALELLAKENSRLNAFVENKETGKKESWKQVNMIFVNLGSDKTEDYGFALQDYWQGGNKNDFVVSFSMNDDGTINWVYPFSWSESELLKIQVRDYFLDLDKITDFTKIVDDTSLFVEKGFERKQFADFNYLRIQTTKGSQIGIWVFNILLVITSIVLGFLEKNGTIDFNRSSYRRNSNFNSAFIHTGLNKSRNRSRNFRRF